MQHKGFHLFETPVGWCGVVWGDGGISGVQLPEATAAATRKRVLERFPGAVETGAPGDVGRAARAMANLLRGKRVDLTAIGLDMDGLPPFHRRVYEAVRTIPPGTTKSYGEVATGLGSASSSRAVGQAMRCNPFPIIVPCHRVLAAGGRAGGFTAPGGVDTKKRILAIEGFDLEVAKTAPVFDYRKAVRALKASDRVLARLIDDVGPLRLDIKQTGSVFGALAEAIVYQQLSGKAAATIYGRVCDLFPRARGGFTPDHILAADDDDLRGAGLSRAKTAALKDLAQKTADGSIPTLTQIRKMSDDDIVDSLTQVRGIGRWTVEMLLIFRLGRPDVLPIDDFGVRKGYSIAFGRAEMPSPKELARIGEKWAPWRSAAAWYLWRATDLTKE